MPTAKIYVAVPCAHDIIVSHCAASLFNTAAALAKNGIEANITAIGASDIEVSRSVFASHFLSEPGYTHLLFVDSDMDFPSSLVLRMLELNEDFVSALYVKRQLDLEGIVKHARNHSDEAIESVVGRLMRYTGTVMGEPPTEDATSFEVTSQKGFVKVEHTGMGLCLLRRRVLEQMIQRGIVTTDGHPYKETPWQAPYYGFFHKERCAAGVPTSEDISFCRRWTRDCGGTIWACVDTAIGHHGNFRFSGAFVQKLKAGEV